MSTSRQVLQATRETATAFLPRAAFSSHDQRHASDARVRPRPRVTRGASVRAKRSEVSFRLARRRRNVRRRRVGRRARARKGPERRSRRDGEAPRARRRDGPGRGRVQASPALPHDRQAPLRHHRRRYQPRPGARAAAPRRPGHRRGHAGALPPVAPAGQRHREIDAQTRATSFPRNPSDLHSPPNFVPNFIVIVQVFLPSAVADDVGVVACLAASEDGRRAFAGVEDGSVVVVDAATGVAASRVVAFSDKPVLAVDVVTARPPPPTTPSGTLVGGDTLTSGKASVLMKAPTKAPRRRRRC